MLEARDTMISKTVTLSMIYMELIVCLRLVLDPNFPFTWT